MHQRWSGRPMLFWEMKDGQKMLFSGHLWSCCNIWTRLVIRTVLKRDVILIQFSSITASLCSRRTTDIISWKIIPIRMITDTAWSGRMSHWQSHLPGIAGGCTADSGDVFEFDHTEWALWVFTAADQWIAGPEAGNGQKANAARQGNAPEKDRRKAKEE